MEKIEPFIFGLIILFMIGCLFIANVSNTPKKIGLGLIGHIMALFGILCFLGGNLLCLWGDILPETMIFPMGYADGVVKNEGGLLFVALQSYNRIQIYDASGKFIKSKYIDASGGIFKIELDEDGCVNVYTSRKNKHYKLDEKGNIVLNEDYTGQYEHHDTYYIDEEGSKYYVSCKYLYPRVIKEDNLGSKHIIIKQPVYLWVLGAPLPSFLIGVIGIFISNWNANKTSKKRR